MSATHPLKPPYVRKPYQSRNPIPKGWTTLKEWILTEAGRHNASYGTIYSWIYRERRYPNLKFIRKNKRVVFVKP